MGVGVDIAGCAVGRPSRVSDTADAGKVVDLTHTLLKLFHLAGNLFHPDLRMAENRNAGGVIPAVFKSFKPVEQHGGRFLISCIADYSAHI